MFIMVLPILLRLRFITIILMKFIGYYLSTYPDLTAIAVIGIANLTGSMAGTNL